MIDKINNEEDILKNEISELDNKVSVDIVDSTPTVNSLFLDESDLIFLNESSEDSDIDVYPGVKLRLIFLNMSENSGNCLKCQKDFDDIKNHKNIFHRGMKEQWCEYCGRLFSRMSKFRKHITEHQSVNNNDRKECYICLIEFDDLKKFKKHMERHSCLHVHLCGKCSKTYMFYDNYAKHLRSVHNEEPPAINVAELSFDVTCDDTLLDLHEKTIDDDVLPALHEKIKETEAFPALHEKTKEDEALTVLNKTKIDNYTENTMNDDASPNLPDETIDESIVSFVTQDSNSFCFKCNRNFANFKLHEYLFHLNKNQIICEICGRQFYKNKLYLSHKTQHKKNKIKCYICNENKFESLRSFMKHLECHDELHVYFCSECSLSFATKSYFDRHLKKLHNNQSKNDTVIEISPDKSETDVEINTRIQYTDNNLTNDTVDIDDSEKMMDGDGDKLNELTPLDLIERLKCKEKNDKKIKKKERKSELCNGNRKLPRLSAIKNNSPDESGEVHNVSQLDDEDLDISFLDKSVDQICFICNEKFIKNSRCNVYNHWLAEHNDYLHQCKICNKKIIKSINLYFHSMKHDDKYPWPCSICDMKCKNYFALRDHITCVHKKIENYVCNICDQKFIFQFTYSCHLRTHNDNLKFKCEYCPRKCHWKRILIPHLKPRRCKYCEIDLPCRTLYDEHFSNRHMNEKLFNCRFCNANYPNKRYLKRHHTVKHLDLVTKKIEYCKYCEFMTNTRRNLNKHVKTAHTAK